MLAGKSLNLPVFKEEEDFTSVKLKKLLQEQTKKNEFLNEKNIRLGVQQRSLLVLLQKKDLVIKELGMLAMGKGVNKEQGGKRIIFWIFERVKGLEKVGFESIKKVGKLNEEIRLRGKEFVRYLETIWFSYARVLFLELKKVRVRERHAEILCDNVRKIWARFGFNRIEEFVRCKNKQNLLKLKSITALLRIKDEIKTYSKLRNYFFSSWKNIKKNYIQLLKVLIRLKSNRKQYAFKKIQKWFLIKSTNQLQNELSNSEKKCKSFSKAFLSINTLYLILKNKISLKKHSSFFKWRQKPTQKNLASLIIILKTLLKSRFHLLLNSFRKPRFLIFHTLSLSKKLSAFSTLFNYSSNLSIEMYSFEADTISSQNKSLSSSNQTKKTKNIELEQENFEIKKKINLLETNKKSRLSELNEKNAQCKDLEKKLEKYLQDVKKFELEAEEKFQNEGEHCEQLMREVEKNNQVIEKIEKSIDFYCADIGKIENEGRMAALQLSQLEASLKKAQELFNSAVNEKTRVMSAESETKKQKVLLAGKIDLVAEEKEKYLNRLQEILNEKKNVLNEIQEKKQKLLEIEEIASEHEAKLSILNEKKRRISDNLDEEFDVKGNLLFHKEKELQKLKETLNQSKLFTESLLKDLNSKIKSEEKERISKINSELSSISQKNEEILREVTIENQKVMSLSSNMQSISYEKEKMNEEFKIIQENLNKSSQYNQNLKEKLFILTNSIKHPQSEEINPNLREYSLSLEAKVKELTEELARSQGLNKMNSVKAAHEAKIRDLEMKLKDCQEFAMRSRVDVAEAISEIEHYAHILNVMEEKMNETEEKVLICLREKESAGEDLMKIREDYFGFIAKG